MQSISKSRWKRREEEAAAWLLTVSDGPEALLPRCVPHLHLDGLAFQLHRLQSEVDAERDRRWQCSGGQRLQRRGRDAAAAACCVADPIVGMYSTLNSFWV